VKATKDKQSNVQAVTEIGGLKCLPAAQGGG
jgi:hypothetical protein